MFLNRCEIGMPYQNWNVLSQNNLRKDTFPPEAIVLVKNGYGESRIDLVKNLWWGYEMELGHVADSVITRARRLDRRRNVNV
jgi:hypothetical protein